MSVAERLAAAALVVASMIAVGLELDRDRLRTLGAHRALLARAMLATLVVVPAGAALVLALLPLDLEVHTGLALAACAPGGASATVLAARARGDTALTAALVVLATITGGVATPVLVALLVPAASPGGALETALRGAAIASALQLVPLGLAALARARIAPARAHHAASIANRIANLLLVSLVLFLAVTRASSVLALGPFVLGGAGALTALALAASHGLTRDAGPAQRAAVSMSTAIRSLSLALALAATLHPAPRTTEAILVYGLAMNVVSGAAAELARRTRAV